MRLMNRGREMRVVIINGQNHKGSTYNIARLLADKIGGEIEEFFLPRDFSDMCLGCTQCFMKSETLCPHYDKLRPINEAMESADVLILASPVYVYHVTGSMKAWLDHYGYMWMVHRPRSSMFSKQAVCISTAAGGGMKSTNKDMADTLYYWGIGKIYKLGYAVAATSWATVNDKKKKKIEKDIDKLARKIKSKYGKVKPGLKTKAFFNIMCMLQKNGWNEVDANYYKENGWTNKKRPWIK